VIRTENRLAGDAQGVSQWGEGIVMFQVLGPLEVVSGGVSYVPRGPQIRKILSLLVLRRNRFVDIGTLVEELWEETPPRTAVTSVRTHVYHLRRMLADESGAPLSALRLVTQPGGYLLRLSDDEYDAAIFDRLLTSGRVLLRQDRLDEAAHALRRALEMWRGPALANVSPGNVVSNHVVQLDEARNRALELRIDIDLRRGRHRDLVAELRGLVGADPLNEWLHVRLIEALHRSGRRYEAITAFEGLRTALRDELGLEPSVEARRIHHKILRLDDAGGD
jgi:SARP family transcriptional regulator, regulator of embCAB operon